MPATSLVVQIDPGPIPTLIISTPNFIKKGNWSYNNCMIDRTGNCKKRIKPFY